METTSIKICFQHLFLPKLSGLRCVSYQAIRTKNNQGVFHQRASLHPVAKFTKTYAHKLSGQRCVSYHDRKKNFYKSLRVSGAFKRPQYARDVNDIHIFT